MSEKRGLPILLLGLLSMTFAEVFSGSSADWPFNIVLWIIAFPVYWSHVLFFLALAVRTKRTSISQLYLWGILFGLYEVWVTKVVWGGFMEQTTPPAIQIFGIAVIETIMIILFWHPLFSFIIPVLVYQMLICSENPKARILSGHSRLMELSKRNRYLSVAIVIMGGSALAGGANFYIPQVLATAIASVALVYIVYRLSIRGDRRPSIETVILGKRGTIGVGVFILVYYLITFPLFLPERIAGLDGMIAVLAMYLITLMLLKLSPEVPQLFERPRTGLMNAKWVFRVLVVFIHLAAVMAGIAVLGMIIYLTDVIFMLIAGPAIFVFVAVKLLSRRKSMTSTQTDSTML